MNINELFNFVDSVKPSAFDDETKMVWLNELEAMIQTEVYLKAEPELYKNDDEELHLMPPYDSVYRYYLQAMIDFHNGEYDKYNATYEMFNEKYGDFEVWYTTHFPTVGSIVRGVTIGGDVT